MNSCTIAALELARELEISVEEAFLYHQTAADAQRKEDAKRIRFLSDNGLLRLFNWEGFQYWSMLKCLVFTVRKSLHTSYASGLFGIKLTALITLFP